MSDKLIEKLANPAPLGLLGFGLTTVLLNLHNAGLFGLNAMILAMGLAYGGLAQILVGMMEFKKGNTFGMVAFTSYGLFWWSLVALILLPGTTFFGTIAKAEPNATAAYFFMWGLFTLVMFFGTLKSNRTLQFVFASLFVLFFMLTIRDATGNPALFGTFTWGQLTGIEGIICGASAVYLGLAEVINEVHGRTILPILPVKK